MEAAINLKDSLNNFEITRVSRLTTSYVSGKLFNSKSPRPAKLQIDRACNSFENSPVSSPVYLGGEDSPFSDGMSESFFSMSMKHAEDTAPRTVMIRNLPPNTTCDDLFKLFGMYGNISKAKIFYKSPDTGLVQFQESYQAGLARKFLNNCPLGGYCLNVTFSKSDINTSIHENSDFYKDFATQKGQRYRKVGSKNFRNIAQPSKVLHLSNLQLASSPGLYIDLFGTCGTVVKYMVLSGDSQNILVEMGSIQESVDALVKFHNCEIEGNFLKVSFSKYDSIKFL